MTLPGNGSDGRNRCESSTSTPSLDNASGCTRRSGGRGSIGPPKGTSRIAQPGSARAVGDESARSFRMNRRYGFGELQTGSETPIQSHPRSRNLGRTLTEKTSQDPSADSGVTVNVTSVTANLEGVAGRRRPKAHPTITPSRPLNRSKTIPKQQLSHDNSGDTQNILPWQNIRWNFFEGNGIGNFYFEEVREKSCLGVPTPKRLTPATLGRLEGAFPRSRFLTLDVETTGLSASRDGVRTVQISDGATAAMLVFDQPVAARALVVLADFLRGRRVVAHNARFEASWLQQAGIDLVLDDTVLLFSAVRGTRSPKGGKRSGGGRISLAALAAMVLGETLNKSEQVSDWAAPTLSASQLTYALNDAIVTHRIWEALRAELHCKSKQHGVDIVAGYEDMRFSAAMAHRMECVGIGFDVAAHQAWIARKQQPVAVLEAHLATLDPALS